MKAFVKQQRLWGIRGDEDERCFRAIYSEYPDFIKIENNLEEKQIHVFSWFKNTQRKIEKNTGFTWSVSSMFIEYRNIIDASSGPFQTSEMQCFAKIVNDFCRLPIFAKQTILEISQGSECTSS